jgi:hypothetical protein
MHARDRGVKRYPLSIGSDNHRLPGESASTPTFMAEIRLGGMAAVSGRCEIGGMSAKGRLEPFTRIERDRWSRRTANGLTGWQAAIPDLCRR